MILIYIHRPVSSGQYGGKTASDEHSPPYLSLSNNVEISNMVARKKLFHGHLI